MKKVLATLLMTVIFIVSGCSVMITENPDPTRNAIKIEGLPAFPGAEGFGANTKGGRGGRVIYVTNLNDSGQGSLREAILAEGARTVIFNVSGTIELERMLTINNPNITIAGQTAPGDGITLKNFGISVRADEVILRYIRVRLGEKAESQIDSMDVVRGNNIIVDHCTTSWAVDELLSVAQRKSDSNKPALNNVTVQWCIISEPFGSSYYADKDRAFGTLVRGAGGSKFTIHHNLYAHCKLRTPRVGNYIDKETDPIGMLLDFRNNVIYNFGGSYSAYNWDINKLANYNFVNNYYKRGPQTDPKYFYIFEEQNNVSKAFFFGNSIDGEVVNQKESIMFATERDNDYLQSQPFAFAYVTTESSADAYNRVLQSAGASKVRDEVDMRIIKETKEGTGRQVPDSANCTWPILKSLPAPKDSDGDGMPDDFETQNGLNPNDISDGNKTTLSKEGYTNLEVYLNSLVA